MSAPLDYAGVRQRLGSPLTPPPKVRLDLIGRRAPAAVPTVKQAEPVRQRPFIVLPAPRQHTWPAYPKPVFYDHCDGLTALPPLTSLRIIREVSAKHDVSVEDMLSPRRDYKTVRARQEAFWRLHHETGMPFKRIGRRFGGKDHTTVRNGVRKHEQRMAALEDDDK